jgi:hypothetical protein
MATVLKSGEQIQVFIDVGATVDAFILDTSQLNGIDVLDGNAFDDVAEYVQSLSIARGRSSQLDQFSAGRCTITLLNNDRRFDPINELSPYWNIATSSSGFTPRRRIRVTLNGLDVYVGRIADIDVNYDFELSTVTLTAVDDFVLLANTFTGAAFTPSEQLSGARVESILDLAAVDFPPTRAISTGVTTLGAYQVDANTNALSYLQACAEAERGYFYVAADGDLTFTDRADVTFIPSIVTTFTDSGGGLPYQALDVIYGQELLYNRIQVTRESGTLQTANDLTSQTTFGVSTYAIDNVLLASDLQASTLADSLLTQYSQPRYRFDNLRVNMLAFTNLQRDEVNTLELGTVVDVIRTYDSGFPLSVTQTYLIERISHLITPGSHTVEFGLRYADLVNTFILDDVVFGVLDADNALV